MLLSRAIQVYQLGYLGNVERQLIPMNSALRTCSFLNSKCENPLKFMMLQTCYELTSLHNGQSDQVYMCMNFRHNTL